MSELTADAAEILRACKLLVVPGGVVELRVIDASGGTQSGYFSSPQPFVNAAVAASDKGASGVYVTLNAVNPALLSRASNRMRTRMGKKDAASSDKDVPRRTRLLVDLDAVRPSGISATDAEHDAALARAREIRARRASEGWPEPLLADSGNGGHLVYAIDEPGEDEALVERCLAALAARHDDARIHVDRTVFNPARISKVYGTAVRKGDCTKDRPHRLARILESPVALVPVSHDALVRLAAEAPAPTTKTGKKSRPSAEGGGVDKLGRWIERRGVAHDPAKQDSSGRAILPLVACPFDGQHVGGSAAVGIATGGGWFFGCKHDSCSGRDWAAFRAQIGAGDSRLTEAREAVPGILAAAKDDPGAPFEPEALEALSAVRELEPAGWARARAALRKLKVSLRDLDAQTISAPESAPVEPSPDYQTTSEGFFHVTPGPDGTETRARLTNFTAKIVASVEEDDGVEVRRVFTLSTSRGHGFDVPSEQFASLGWVLDRMGPDAIVYSGPATRDHARVAIQCSSGAVEDRHTFTHAGWREVDDEWVYLHGAGAVSSRGAVPGVSVRLDGALAPYRLPDPPEGEDLAAAVRASLHMVDVAPDLTSIPVFAAVWRAVLGASDLSVWILGPSGEGKSELAALAQQHWGPALDARHLPGSWSSTVNALEGVAFLAKDALLVVDDFAPHGSASDVARLHRDADRLIRAQGNGQGRQRMRPDATLRPAKPPRGLILGTGEDVPHGFSLRARMAVVEVAKGSLDFGVLTACQKDAAAGLYAQALSGFVRWLAADFGETLAALPETIASVRASCARDGDHRRTPQTTANLGVGLDFFTRFAVQAGAMSEGEREAFMERGWAALMSLAEGQLEHQQHAEPAARFLALLSGALAAGRCHVMGGDGLAPETPALWGWRLAPATHEGAYDTVRPQGDQIGWLTAEGLMLDPEPAYAAARRFSVDGDGVTVGLKTLQKRLVEKGVAIPERDEAGKLTGRNTVQRRLSGVKRRVLHLPPTGLWPDADVPEPQHAAVQR